MVKALTVTAVLMLAAASCGGEHSSPNEPSPFPPGILAELRKEARGEQIAALSDGNVTFQEYEDAVLSTVACLKASGAADVRATLSPSGTRYQLRFSVPADDESAIKRSDTCLADHLSAIESAWQFLHRPSEAQIATARTALISCLEDSGIDVPDNPTPGYFVSLAQMPAYQRCATRIQAEYDVPGFGG